MSYSGGESNMEEDGGSSNNHRHRHENRRRRRNDDGYQGGDEYIISGGCGGGEDSIGWNEFADNFSKVQTVLDRNRILIQQANENHQSRIPDNMAKNVAIIQELNGNISKVASLYSDLSVNFAGSVNNQRRFKGGDTR